MELNFLNKTPTSANPNDIFNRILYLVIKKAIIRPETITNIVFVGFDLNWFILKQCINKWCKCTTATKNN